jgi:hypothetical protein
MKETFQVAGGSALAGTGQSADLMPFRSAGVRSKSLRKPLAFTRTRK